MAAQVRQRRIKRRLFTLLTKELLHDAVAADADLEQTCSGAAVAVAAIRIVALFRGFQGAVTAQRSCRYKILRRTTSGGRPSSAASDDVLSSRIAAETGAGNPDAAFTTAGAAASIATATVTVIALFGRLIDEAVAADRKGDLRGTGTLGCAALLRCSRELRSAGTPG